MRTVSDAAKQEGTMKPFVPNVATNDTSIRSRNRQDKLLNISGKVFYSCRDKSYLLGMRTQRQK